MKNILVTTLFMLATLAWAVAQQPGNAPERSSGQATAPSSQVPDANQSQPSTPGGSDQAGLAKRRSRGPNRDRVDLKLVDESIGWHGTYNPSG